MYSLNAEKIKGKLKMGQCKLCGKDGENLTLTSADHKDLGRIMVCTECWKKLYKENRMVCGATGSGGTCPSCR
jgi:predicted SprT family Zn-dependent metalloprotease